MVFGYIVGSDYFIHTMEGEKNVNVTAAVKMAVRKTDVCGRQSGMLFINEPKWSSSCPSVYRRYSRCRSMNAPRVVLFAGVLSLSPRPRNTVIRATTSVYA